LISEIDEKYQLDATTVIYYHKISLHISGIYMLIFRSTVCTLLHMTYSSVKESWVYLILVCAV